MKYRELYEEYEYLLSKRSDCAEKEIKIIDGKLDNLETAAKALDKNLNRRLLILKRCFLMDSMPAEMRKKSLEFGSAMTALEGLPASADTEENLARWADGEYSFKDGYMQTLGKYNLIGGML